MSGKRGCFKNGCFGCLGLIALIILVVLISALIAKTTMEPVKMEDRWLAATESISAPAPSESGSAIATQLKGGRVILKLGQGEFEIKPAKAGEPLRVQAAYDSNNYFLEENYKVLPDSTWVYQLEYYRTQNGMQALIQEIFGNSAKSRIVVYLPTDVPLDLQLRIKEGGMESELGGLWLNDADLYIGKGGFIISIDEPLQQPMGNLRIHGSMGGLVVSKLGNASPQNIDLSWKMGGADLDLRGAWLNDCDIKLVASMGGMEVRVPDDVLTIGMPGLDDAALGENQEIPLPVLRFDVETSMGGFEARR